MPPVHDHEISPFTQISSVKPYGCSNAQRKELYRAQLGWIAEVVPRFYMQPDTASKDCRYDGRKNDPRCGECELLSDVKYLESYGKCSVT